MYPISVIIYGLFVLGAMVAALVLYPLTLFKTLKLIEPGNRTLDPKKVWLIIIPFFNVYWSIVVVKKLSESIGNEFQSRGIETSSRPTYIIGLIYSILCTISNISNLIDRHSWTNALIVLIATIAWIIYWANVSDYKKKLSELPPKNAEDEESLIFKNIPVQH